MPEHSITALIGTVYSPVYLHFMLLDLFTREAEYIIHLFKFKILYSYLLFTRFVFSLMIICFVSFSYARRPTLLAALFKVFHDFSVLSYHQCLRHTLIYVQIVGELFLLFESQHL